MFLPGGSTISRELLSPFVNNCGAEKVSVSLHCQHLRLKYGLRQCTNLFKESWESGLNLMDKFLPLLLQKVFTPVEGASKALI